MNKQDFKKSNIAYFTMEVGLDPKMFTYSGGLGVLAGDTLKSCADLGVSLIALTLLNEKGYFAQELDAEGAQAEVFADWPKEEFLTLLPVQVSVDIEGREVRIQVWEYIIKGITGSTIPVYFLDTNLQETAEYDRSRNDAPHRAIPKKRHVATVQTDNFETSLGRKEENVESWITSQKSHTSLWR